MPKPCRYCGSTLHFSYQCFKNPKRGKVLKKKYEQAYKTGKTPKHDKLLSNQTLDRKRLIMELDRYVSLYVRVRDSDKYGIGTCIACGRRFPFRQMDNGHYRSRQAFQTRWDFLNCNSECQNCNRVLRGNLKKYREGLVRKIGEDKVRELETRPPRKISTPELQEMLDEMKIKYKKLVENKKKSLYN